MPTSLPNFNFLAPLVTELWIVNLYQHSGEYDLHLYSIALILLVLNTKISSMKQKVSLSTYVRADHVDGIPSALNQRPNTSYRTQPFSVSR